MSEPEHESNLLSFGIGPIPNESRKLLDSLEAIIFVPCVEAVTAVPTQGTMI